MSRLTTTFVAIYAKNTDTFALDAAIGEAVPNADVESRYLDGSNPHDAKAEERGFDAVTTVLLETSSGPVPRFAGLFDKALQPFSSRIEVHCIERDEETFPEWVSRFNVEAPWREVTFNSNEMVRSTSGPVSDIKTRVVAYADEQTVWKMFEALSEALPDASVRTDNIPEGKEFDTRNGKMLFKHSVLVHMETRSLAGIPNPFEKFIAPTLASFGDKMVLIARQGTSDDADSWDYVGVIDLRWRELEGATFTGDREQSYYMEKLGVELRTRNEPDKQHLNGMPDHWDPNPRTRDNFFFNGRKVTMDACSGALLFEGKAPNEFDFDFEWHVEGTPEGAFCFPNAYLSDAEMNEYISEVKALGDLYDGERRSLTPRFKELIVLMLTRHIADPYFVEDDEA